MAEDDLLPKSLQKLEIDSLSQIDSESQPTLESLTLRGDECPQESCKCNKKGQTCDKNTSSAWNRRRFVQKPFSSQLSSTQSLGIIRKSRFKTSNSRSKTWILREPILKLESLTRKEEISSSSSASPVRLDKKPATETPGEISKLSLGQSKSQGRIFGACTSVTPTDFSRLCPSKSVSLEAKEPKQFTATSYRHIRFSAPSQPSKVVKRKKDHRKEGSMKTRPISETSNTLSARQTSSHPSGSQSTTCSQQARMVGTSHVSSGSDDVTIDELASYFDLFVHIPRKMSHMAENMYI
ncbi:oxidative stress-responsive serine-rich protein 1 [Thrips palmi]|uniref:Oxidative stress-responsive serine-rich protein 1 n=1 Tax=Thrips palmi TaxID=161013 RepID=A0A6P8YIW3_THRPL|nr:oxidative stress-responsive serine-rich protein 1 [Thrips palmi]XP_034239763.1 oxidative stress-responsive serine-rich protein 1 [Thrips palmi]XP_034239774.1 oxidative stress-responsive serine-rich protein 1 [Thrips palmi]